VVSDISQANLNLADLSRWFYENTLTIALAVLIGVVLYATYRLIAGWLTRLEKKGAIKENLSFMLKRTTKFLLLLLYIAILFPLLGVDVGFIMGLIAVAGGTIVGFAAMNTLGNAIAGLIIMMTQPFKVGDRLYFNGQFVDVEAIDLMYTRMKTFDNVVIYVPNQELLRSEIHNYAEKSKIRVSCSITADYDLDYIRVQQALLEAAKQVDGVLSDPEPYVWITGFQNYAAEYTLYVYTDRIKQLQEFQAQLRRKVLETCRKNGIEIVTPTLVKSMQ